MYSSFSIGELLCTGMSCLPRNHGIKGFVIPTKPFVKIGITKIFCYNNKMFISINKTFGCCIIIFGCSNQKFICCPWFRCRNKTISVRTCIENGVQAEADFNDITSGRERSLEVDRHRWPGSGSLANRAFCEGRIKKRLVYSRVRACFDS